MSNLEGEKPQVEEVEPTPQEEVKPTEPKEKPTVRMEETEEFRHALDKALGKSTASFQAQVTLAKQAEKTARAETEVLKASQAKTQQDIEFLEGKLAGLADDRFADDSEALKGYKNTIALELRERKATAKEEALKLKEIEQENFRKAYLLGEKANELREKYQVPKEVLESCTSAEQMEIVAKHFPEVGVEEPKVKAPKFDSGVPSGGGQGMPESAKGKIRAGWDELHKNK